MALNAAARRAALMLAALGIFLLMTGTLISSSPSRTTPAAPLVREDGRRQCLAALTSNVVDVTGGLITSGPVAYIDPPLHWNLGDSYIWAGANAVLDQLGVRPSITCTFYEHQKSAAQSSPTRCNETDLDLLLADGGTILLHGGGNFGDIYHDLQSWRVNLTTRPALQKSRFVFLPQSVEYRDAETATTDMRVLAAHPDVHIMVRCQFSYNYLLRIVSTFASIAQRTLASRIYLVPDMALALGDLSNGHSFGACPDGPTHDVVMLMRLDNEVSDDVKGSTAAATDLLVESDRDFIVVDWFNYSRPDVRLPLLPSDTAFDTWPMDFRAASSVRVAMGVAMLCRGEVIVTDRLHALILGGLLMGKPVAYMEPAYDKLSRFIDTWIREDSRHGCLPEYFRISAIQRYYFPLSVVAEGQTVRAVRQALAFLNSIDSLKESS